MVLFAEWAKNGPYHTLSFVHIKELAILGAQ